MQDCAKELQLLLGDVSAGPHVSIHRGLCAWRACEPGNSKVLGLGWDLPQEEGFQSWDLWGREGGIWELQQQGEC